MQDRYDKLIESAVHLMNGSAHDPNFGMTKLVKLLYYADCTSYILHGESITGTTYIHFPHGPYPENWYIVRQNMETSGAATIIRDASASGYYRYWLRANRPADMESLSSEDVRILDEQLQRFANFNASAIEEFSHQDAGWLATEDGEPIPYELAGIIAPNLSPISIEIGLEIAKNIHGR